MILKDWLKRENIVTSHFCQQLGLAHASIYNSMNKTHILSAKNALLIEAVTQGDVPREHAMFPFDYIDINANGETQYRMSARIHTELAKGVVLKRKGDKKIYSDKQFYKWAYGEPRSQPPVAHCYLWSLKHPTLEKVDQMSIEKGLKYMREQFEKAMRKLERKKNGVVNHP